MTSILEASKLRHGRSRTLSVYSRLEDAVNSALMKKLLVVLFIIAMAALFSFSLRCNLRPDCIEPFPVKFPF